MLRCSTSFLSAAVVVALLIATTATVSAELEVKLAEAACSQYSRCSECVYDAASVNINRRTIVKCAWCPSTSRCFPESLKDDSCPSNRTMEHNSECEDMQCLGAKGTGNIYMCRAGMVFAVIFSIILIGLSMVYGAWYRVIQQAPWRYRNLNHALGKLMDTHGGAWAASQKAAKSDILSADREFCISKKDRKLATYDQWAFGCNDEERFWTQVKRYAFFPMAISAIVGAICVLLLFTSSLRPYFADVYYGLVLTAGYGALALMMVYVRLFQPSVCQTREGGPQTYFDLAVFLHGRKIDTVFPIVDANRMPIHTGDGAAAAAAAEDDGSPTADDQPKKTLASIASEYEMTPLGVDRKDDGVSFDAEEATAAAASGFELDETVPADFRTKVQELVKADEAILWFDSPDRNIVGIEFNWLYQLFFAGLGFSVFLYVLSGVTPYPDLLLPPSNLVVIALCLTLFCFIMFAVLSAGCKRIYIMTSTRLILIARSVTGGHNVNAVNLSDIKYCTLTGYKEMGHLVMSVAWERASPTVRRMPKMNTDRFVAVSHLDSLLTLLVPRLPSNALPPTFHEDLVHNRYVWRVHAALNMLVFFMSPVLVVYSKIFPGGFSVIAMLLVMAVNLTVLHRAVRVLTTTVAPITVSTGSRGSDSSFSLTKTLQYIGQTLPMFIPNAIRRATGNGEDPEQNQQQQQQQEDQAPADHVSP